VKNVRTVERMKMKPPGPEKPVMFVVVLESPPVS
jgi:hypothetical protein